MLRLDIDLALGPGRMPLPRHLGGVLHGLLEAAALHQAPALLARLRPAGLQAPAAFALQAPPIGDDDLVRHTDSTEAMMLRFSVLLYGTADSAWPEVLQALHAHRQHRLQGRHFSLTAVSATAPGLPTWRVWHENQLLTHADVLRAAVRSQALTEAALTSLRHTGLGLHRLQLRAPLLLASRGAARAGLQRHGSLPWPTLAQVLDSISQRLRVLEPGLFHHLGLDASWRAGPNACRAEALTPATRAAYQVEWIYRSTSRSDPPGSGPRSIALPGLLGTLVYLASGDPREAALLEWGQWLGVGQKTTLGCGQYRWTLD